MAKDQDEDLALSPRAYEWASRAFEAVRDRLGLRVRLHDDAQSMASGHIFLFNHFARFETVIPPYLLYRGTGAYTRSIADHQLFEISPRFSSVLSGLGAVPNDRPGLLPFLAAEILRGRKVSVFPEGGMVKDRAVVDPENGRFSVFSRTASGRRPHHRGAAILALVLDVYKQRILAVAGRGERDRLQRWCDALGLEDINTLIARAKEPTRVVPGYITFHPIRIGDTFLSRAVERFANEFPAKAMEELLIESNILFRPTDMDIRLGAPVVPDGQWKWWDRRLIDAAFERVDSLHEMFELRTNASRWLERLATRRLARGVDAVRDAWMEAMYAGVTVNLSHLAGTLIRRLVERGDTEVDRRAFDRLLYRAVKALQARPAAHLHDGLIASLGYQGLVDGRNAALDQFLCIAEQAGLVAVDEKTVRFLEKLCHSHDFDSVRLENPIAVYANEAAPIRAVGEAVEAALEMGPAPSRGRLAMFLFDDEQRDFELCLKRFHRPEHAAINALETATASGAPFLIVPRPHRRVGVLLIHGFLASPAEVRGLGDRLAARGHAVLGVRLAGHGTSPWDLRERSWVEWLDSVRRGYRVLADLCDSVVVVGFSAGGDLALALAAERPERLSGVCTVCAPLAFRDRNMVFVPLVHGLNKVMAWWSAFEDGVMPFRPNDSEHPEVNYRHIPVRGLYELRRLVAQTLRLLPRVATRVLVVQADADPVVDPASARQILRRLEGAEASLREVPASRHGILYEDIGGAQEIVADFVDGLEAEVSSLNDRPAMSPPAPPASSISPPLPRPPVPVGSPPPDREGAPSSDGTVVSPLLRLC